MNLINKDALLAEIYRLRDFTNDRRDIEEMNGIDKFLDKLIPFINSLEVKEVDMEEELDEWMKYGPHTSYPWCTIPDAIKITAEYFFELGFKAQSHE